MRNLLLGCLNPVARTVFRRRWELEEKLVIETRGLNVMLTKMRI